MAFVSHKFWMGFNSFVLLFIAINVATIGVEIDSRIPFILALGYMIYMSIYLSKGATWKVYTLIGIGVIGVLFYLLGLAFKITPANLYSLAWTHIILSLVLTGGSLAHLKSKH